jgi:hypothetical protein
MLPIPFWVMVRALRSYEGWRCLWRLPVAGMAVSMTVLLPAAGAVATVYIGADLKLAHVALAALVGVGVTYGTNWYARRKLWRGTFSHRLWTYEKPNPFGAVPILVKHDDVPAARRALCHDRLHLTGIAIGGNPPADAPELNTRASVEEPAAWTRSATDEERNERVRSVLADARIRARVAGTDTFPGGG